MVGKKWHERRKIITPAFHFKILEQFVDVFDRIGNVVVEKLQKYDPTDDVEFYPIAVLYALDVMCGKWNSNVRYMHVIAFYIGKFSVTEEKMNYFLFLIELIVQCNWCDAIICFIWKEALWP